jgi:hypothetical protein
MISAILRHLSKTAKSIDCSQKEYNPISEIFDPWSGEILVKLESNGNHPLSYPTISPDSNYVYAVVENKLHRWDISALTAHANQAEQYKN